MVINVKKCSDCWFSRATSESYHLRCDAYEQLNKGRLLVYPDSPPPEESCPIHKNGYIELQIDYTESDEDRPEVENPMTSEDFANVLGDIYDATRVEHCLRKSPLIEFLKRYKDK